MRLIYQISDKGTTFGTCPYCKKDATIHYETMYECTECGKRSTNDELIEQKQSNDYNDEQEREWEFEKLRKSQREEEYKEKLKDLKDEYSDLRR
jgi:DNA-binding PadR family transcriptional regulator